MRTAEQWLQEYGVTHQNPLNRKIHKICVPLIFWSVFAILWSLPRFSYMEFNPYVNWATVVLFPVLVFYLSLGLIFFVDMLFASVLTVLLILVVEKLGWPLPGIGLGVFVGAWIGQFYGHKIEGKKPAFLQDLLFLLIGPLWIINGLKVRRS